jgi:hypothetical protein
MLGYVKVYSRGLRWVYHTNNKEKAVDILVNQAEGIQRERPDRRSDLQEHDRRPDQPG